MEMVLVASKRAAEASSQGCSGPKTGSHLRISQVTSEFPRPASLNSRCCPFRTRHRSSLVTGRLTLYDNTLSLLNENRDFRDPTHCRQWTNLASQS